MVHTSISTPEFGACDPSRLLQPAAMRGEAEIVIVEGLFAVRLVTDRPRLPEVEGATVDRLHDAGRDQLVIDRQIGGGHQHQAVVENVAAAAIFEVEIGMVREVAQRRLVAWSP